MDNQGRIQRYEPAGRALEGGRVMPPASYVALEMVEAPDLRTYWRILRKRRWTILSVFFILVSVVLLGSLRMTPIYQASVLLEIQKENPEILSVRELFELDSVSDIYLRTQYSILESDNLARRVVANLGLTKMEEFNPPPRWWSPGRLLGGEKEEPTPNVQVFAAKDAPVEVNRQTMEITLQNFQDRLSILPLKNSRLVEVQFESANAALAARIANALAADYIEQNLEARWEATQKASEWLSQQLVNLKIRLEKSEEELQKYARENRLFFLNTDQENPENIVNERLRQLQQALTVAQAARYEKESLYALVQSGDYSSLPGVQDNRLVQDLNYRLAELRRVYADLTTTFTPDYPKVKQVQSQIDEVTSVLTKEQEKAAQRISRDYEAGVERERLLTQAIETLQARAGEIAEKSVQYNILRREVETNRQLYQGLLQRLKEAGVSAGLKASNVRVVDPAVTPLKPAKPNIPLNLGVAGMLGLGLGVGAAFLQEYLDNSLKTAEDVERFLRVPALALIPSIESLNGHRGSIYGVFGARKLLGKKHEDTTALVRPAAWVRIDRNPQHSAFAEAFRSLRTSVLLSTADHPPRSLLVSSSQPGEGKTTVSANLSITLAQLGQRVLLIDGDLRRPCVHRCFETQDLTGLVGFLTGQAGWHEVVRSTSVPGLDILACGPVPPNPAELLSSARMRDLIAEAYNTYNFVVLDSAPLLSVADARILSALVDGVVLVVRGGETPRELAQRAQSYTQNVGGNVIGVVLNNLDVRTDDYYYARYYGSDGDIERRDEES